MNKILIVYASKYGSTEKCAYKLANILKLVEVVNLNSAYNIDLDDYDTIIIGGNIKMGILSKKVKKFIKENKEKLLTKNTAYFMCCGFRENKGQYFQANIPKDLLESAITYDVFGGELNINKCNSIDKMIIKGIKADTNNIKLDQNAIKSFAKTILLYKKIS